jgi:hypothetical protein
MRSLQKKLFSKVMGSNHLGDTTFVINGPFFLAKLTYLLAEKSPKFLLENDLRSDKEPGGCGVLGVNADVGLHREGVRIRHPAILRLRVNAVELRRSQELSSKSAAFQI